MYVCMYVWVGMSLTSARELGRISFTFRAYEFIFHRSLLSEYEYSNPKTRSPNVKLQVCGNNPISYS
jgi:hypothetical protein